MSATSDNTRVLLIGAARGLGYAIAAEYVQRGAHVVATVRSDDRTALHELRDAAADRLEIERVDINEPDQVRAISDRLGDRRFDLLFVIAGVTHRIDETAANITTEEFTRVLVTNALSPMRVVETLGGPLVDPSGTIAIMSSGQGSVANNHGGGWEIYRASKAALNQLMRSYAARHDDRRTLLLLAPGWVRTEMGGPDARLTIDESIPSLVTTLDAQRGRPGLQYLDYRGQTVPW